MTGHNLGRVLNSRSGWMYAIRLCCSEAKVANLEVKTTFRFSPVKSRSPRIQGTTFLREKHSSLLQKTVNCSQKKFYNYGHRRQSEPIVIVETLDGEAILLKNYFLK